MPSFFVRHVLLRGLPRPTVDACIAHPQVRALLRFRFAYLIAFHSPVLVPLLELLSGHIGPALGVLSLGVASLAMVVADVPTGLYADRNGAKAALRLGLRITAMVMLGFFLLGLWRAFAEGHSNSAGTKIWLPGAIGLLLLEMAIGVGLALLSGADTVLFLAVAQKSDIPELGKGGFEGVGSAIRYLGTMLGVAVGAIFYELVTFYAKAPAWRIVLQNSLFLLTLGAELWALRLLQKLPNLHVASLVRPGLQEVLRSLAALFKWPQVFANMWLLCLSSSAALFAVYLFQSPLGRLTGTLFLRSLWFGPLYTLVSMLGYWACSRGSHHSRLYHHEDPRSDPRARRVALGSALGSFFLLALYPLGVALHFGLLAMVAATALVCIGFNYLRGFIEPYSSTAILAFSQRQGHCVPASTISGFNSLKRGIHFGLSGLYFLLQHSATVQAESGTAHKVEGVDILLAKTVLYVALGFAVAMIPALGVYLRKSLKA